jgi:hypothetical protein
MSRPALPRIIADVMIFVVSNASTLPNLVPPNGVLFQKKRFGAKASRKMKSFGSSATPGTVPCGNPLFARLEAMAGYHYRGPRQHPPFPGMIKIADQVQALRSIFLFDKVKSPNGKPSESISGHAGVIRLR